MAVEKSAIKVIAGSVASKEPLFRFEFVRGLPNHIPEAHLQIHAHRDDLTWMMTRADRDGTGEVRRLRDLHFPLGGARFRPCLEDVVEMLIHEFGVDTVTDDAHVRLAAGRLKWRDLQLRTSVRDNPPAAVTALAELGYSITDPAAGPRVPDVERLKRL